MPRFNFTIQDSSPLISYTGLWMEGDSGKGISATSHDESYRMTRDNNAKVTFDFVGTGVSIFGRGKRQDYGNYSIRLDNAVKYASPSSIGQHELFQVDLWHIHGLKNEPHTVEARNEPAGLRSYFDIDFITIEREIGRIGDNIFNSTIDDDTNSSVQYHGEWERDLTFKTQNYGQTLHTTITPDSLVEITFQGCCIELYGLYANAAYSVSMDGGAPKNMQGIDVDLAGNLWHPKTLLYLMDGLSEGYHKVSLRATNTSQIRPFSFDYAVVQSTKNSSNAGPSKGTRVGLAVGLSLGGLALLGLLSAIFCLFRRRRQRRHTPRMDLMSEGGPNEPPHAPAPTPWMSLAPRPLNVMSPRSHTSFLFSSVVSGWHRVSEMKNRTDTAERFEGSIRRGSTQESVPPVSRLHVATRDG